MEKLIEDMKKAMYEELGRACAIHGDRHHSAAEAYAVIREEIEEAAEGMENVSADHEDFWGWVKGNGGTDEAAERIREHAIHAAAELIQVAAMAQKALRGYEV